MNKRIAVVGMECLYPGASNYKQLWENICAGRKAFRKIPTERLNTNYFSNEADGIYQDQAAVISNYTFDRVKFKIPESTYLATDISHWMALDVASRALNDAQIFLKDTLRKSTGVYVGNTLTGEMTRSNLLRQRWPYVYNSVRLELEKEGWEENKTNTFLNDLEKRFKLAFPVMQEDSLAGGLSNTIAGRICNYFDFNGGGYTVDGACSSSLLAITTACDAIRSGEIVMALAGGVDISLDPFELVGFSRAGALSKNKMHVFSKKSEGFLPGEGCGFVVLMDADIAEEQNVSIYGFINGYGISSDGKGGITRPKASMQERAIKKAYPDESLQLLKYIEAHGTGTLIGDETELKSLNNVTKELNNTVYIGALKEFIGHTKAASGIAGFIKAILITKEKYIPEQQGHQSSHQFLKTSKNLKIADKTINIKNHDFVTGVSAFGFGGINVHVSIKNNPDIIANPLPIIHPSYQDTELFLFSSSTENDLIEKVLNLLAFVEKLSISELSDLSFKMYKSLKKKSPFRLAVIASTGKELFAKLKQWIENKDKNANNIFYGNSKGNVKIGYLFPGQGTGNDVSPSLYENIFPSVRKVTQAFNLSDQNNNLKDTSIAQPYIVRNTVFGLKILSELGIKANIGLGHSLGELSALHWSKAIDMKTLKNMVEVRGKFMLDYGDKNGRMYSVSADESTVKQLLNGYDVVIACENSEDQTIISGHIDELQKVRDSLLKNNIKHIPLKVDRAFHSPLMRNGKQPFYKYVKSLKFNSIKNTILSPTTIEVPSHLEDIHNILADQFDQPVHFYDSFLKCDKDIDVWIEVGSGKTLTNLAINLTDKPIVSVNIAESMEGVLQVSGLLYAKGYSIELEALFNNRFFNEFNIPWSSSFIENPCEKNEVFFQIPNNLVFEEKNEASDLSGLNLDGTVIEVLRKIISKRLNLPIEAIEDTSKMLDDLHLNSIVVGDIIAELSSYLGYTLNTPSTELANANLKEIAHLFEHNNKKDTTIKSYTQPDHHWVDIFKIEWHEESLKNIGLQTELNQWEFIGKDIKVRLPGKGYLVSLINSNEEEVILKLQKLANKVSEKRLEQIIVIQNKFYAGGWIRSFFLEYPETNILLVNTHHINEAIDYLPKELENLVGFREVSYFNKKRKTPLLTNVLDSTPDYKKIGSSDIVLVSGGAKGITAECALALATKQRNRTVIIGRSPVTNEEVQRNLKRFLKEGLIYNYYSCDVTNINKLKKVLETVKKDVGEVTVILHGAGSNEPESVTTFNRERVWKAIHPKLTGLKNLLLCCEKTLQQVITFGSIIANSGMEGNADYALANEWMATALEEWACKHQKRWVNMAWSVWSGTGMGDNLGVLERLRIQGIDPVSIDLGVQKFLEIILSSLQGNLIISGRYGNSKTLKTKIPKLPQYRFIESLILYYPNNELRAEFTLSTQSDLYLEDHSIEGVKVFPTVMSLEAMSQAVAYLRGAIPDSLQFSDVKLKQPIIISEKELRIIVKAYQQDTCIKLELIDARRPEVTYVSANYKLQTPSKVKPIELPVFNNPEIPVNGFLYGELLFHTGRFKCIKKYCFVDSYKAVAQVNFKDTLWFPPNKNQSLLTLYPHLNDAMLHMVQVCVPQYTLLPVVLNNVFIDTEAALKSKNKNWYIYARENHRESDIFNYDISVISDNGDIIIQYLDVDFRIVKGKQDKDRVYSEALLEVALNRMLTEQNMKGLTVEINKELPEYIHRPDGKPLILEGAISKSSIEKLNLTLKGNVSVACDVEVVASRTREIWEHMLGEEDMKIALSINENIDKASTRIWGVRESLRKVGILIPLKLIANSTKQPGGIDFTAGNYHIYSWNAKHYESKNDLIITICQENKKVGASFKHSLIVGFEETNLVGNVYFSNYVKWQGKCREAFLMQNAMQITNEKGEKELITSLLTDGRLALVTCSTECNFLRELGAFDKVNIYLTLNKIIDNRIQMHFTYYRELPDKEELVAEGKQEIACMERTLGGAKMYREMIPQELGVALEPYIE